MSGLVVEEYLDHTISDYLQHGIAYAILAFLLLWAVGPTSRPSAIVCVSLAIGHGTVMEWSQQFIPHRYFERSDLLANMLGVGVGSCAAVIVLSLFHRRKTVNGFGAGAG